MENKFLIIVLLLLASAQFIGVQAQGPPPPPPPAKDYSPNTWDEYSFPDGKLRIRFPEKPTESTVTNERFKIHSIKYKGLIIYEVAYTDYQVPIDDPLKVKDLLQSMKAAALKSIEPKGVRIVSEREVSVDGHAGIFLHLEVAANEVIRVEWIIAGSRLYTISASSRKGIPQELEGENDYEKIALGFINSFHVMP